MLLYHVRPCPRSLPNLEAICETSMHDGWNPERFSGHMGTGLYCTATQPAIRETAFLMVFEAEDVPFFHVTSTLHEALLEEFSKALMRFCVSSFSKHYGSRSRRAPLAGWYEQYMHGEEEDFTSLLVDVCRRLATTTDDALARYLKLALREGRADFMTGFLLKYSNYIRSGASLRQRACDNGRQTPFTRLLLELGFGGVSYTGDVRFWSTRETRGVVLFDVASKPTSAALVEPGWEASSRASLLRSPRSDSSASPMR
jgi:hypothetical protein